MDFGKSSHTNKNFNKIYLFLEQKNLFLRQLIRWYITKKVGAIFAKIGLQGEYKKSLKVINI